MPWSRPGHQVLHWHYRGSWNCPEHQPAQVCFWCEKHFRRFDLQPTWNFWVVSMQPELRVALLLPVYI